MVVTSQQVGKVLLKELTDAQAHPCDLYGIGSFGSEWPKLNEITAGFQKHALGVLASRPKVGKSMLVASWIPALAEQALMEDKVLRVVTLETLVKSYQRRIAAILAKIEHPMRIKSGRLLPDEEDRLRRAYAYVNALPIEYVGVDVDLDDAAAMRPGNSSVTMGDIEAFVGQPDTFWWVLDHIGLVSSPEAQRGDYVAMIYNLANKFKDLAHEKVGGLVITHLSRTSGTSLSLGAIGGSDQLSRNCDQGFILRRPFFEIERPLTEEERGVIEEGEPAYLYVHSRDEEGGMDVLYWNRKTASYSEYMLRPGEAIPLPPTTKTTRGR